MRFKSVAAWSNKESFKNTLTRLYACERQSRLLVGLIEDTQ